jgi:hypothetical protein
VESGMQLGYLGRKNKDCLLDAGCWGHVS